MELKTNLITNKWMKYIMVGGIGLAFIGASYSVMRILKKRRQTLPKEHLMKLLQEIRFEVCPLFMELAGACRSHRNSSTGAVIIPPDEQKELIDTSKSNQILIMFNHVKNI